MVKKNLLKSKMALTEKSCDDCSKALGMTTSNFSKKLNGHVSFSIKQANELSTYLGLTMIEMINIFLS